MTTSPPSGPGRRDRKRTRTRTTILASAHQLFDLHGFAAVPVSMIAVDADVAVQTVFNHFPTKQDLFFEGRCSWLVLAEVVLPRLRAGAGEHGVCVDAVAAAVDELVTGHLQTMARPEKRLVLDELVEDRSLRNAEAEMRGIAEQALAETLAGASDPRARADAGRLAALWLADTWVQVSDGRRALRAGRPVLARRPLEARLLELLPAA